MYDCSFSQPVTIYVLLANEFQEMIDNPFPG